MKGIKFAFVLLLCLFVGEIWSQRVVVSGRVLEADTGEPALAASVVLLRQDSTMASGVSADTEGKFTLPSVRPGSYIFRVSYIGFKTFFKNVKLAAEKPKVDMGDIKLQADAVVLKATEVTARLAQVEMKADTFVYNAGAYRLPEGSMLEELVKKLPGAEVSDDGTITINGKEVKKIMVDGKEFFDNDTKMAMKNLPTTMVEKIKAYDRQSDYTRMTGIDDGEEETVLDLSVKKSMKQGWLVNTDVGGGTEERYTSKIMVNRFTDQTRVTVFGSANNVGDRGMGGSFGGRGPTGGGHEQSKMAGVDFNLDNGKKENEAGRLSMGGNARYSHSGSDVVNVSNSETFLTTGSGNSFSNSYSESHTGNTNVNANFRLEWSPDTMTRLMLRPNFSYSDGYTRSSSNSATFNDDPYQRMTNPLDEYEDYVADSIVVNDNNSRNKSNNNSYSLDATLMINRKLNTGGRNINLRLAGGYSDSDSESRSISDINYFLQTDDDGNTLNEYTRQFNTNPSKSYNYSADLSYSEPLFPGAHLQLSYRYQYRYSDTDRTLYEYGELIDSLWEAGIDFRDNIAYLPGIDLLGAYIDADNSQYATYKEHNQNATVMFRYNKNKIRFNAGVSFQPQKTYMDYEKGSLDTSVVRTVYNWSPRMDFKYKISDAGQLRIRYNGSSSQPSMTNLLDVTDDSDPLNVSKGNPGLKPSWTNRFNLFYNEYITELQMGWMIHADVRMTSNSISTAVLYDESTGKTTSMPMNINGNWNANTSIMFNSALGSKKYFNISTFTTYGYTNSVGYISSDYDSDTNVSSGDVINLSRKSTTKTTNINERLNVNFRNDLIEIGLNGNINYQHARNKLQESANLDTYNFSYGGNIQINFPWNMTLSSNIGQDSRRGYDDESMNTDELIWNAQLSQSFLKGNAATISLQWYDILQEKSNISRSLTATRRTDSWTNSVNSYLMVHFIYRLNLLGNREARAEMRGQRFNGDGPSGDGPGGGGTPPSGGGGRPGGGGGGFGGPGGF